MVREAQKGGIGEWCLARRMCQTSVADAKSAGTAPAKAFLWACEHLGAEWYGSGGNEGAGRGIAGVDWWAN